MAKSSTINYRPDIDGLRAIAVIPVLLFHLESKWIPGGYLGVDVFFVISGFLICKIILRQLNSGEFRFRNFWLRRVKRLFPVSAAVLSITSISGYFTLYTDEWKSLVYQGLSSIFCVSNFYYWRFSNNYWGESAEQMPFLHTWSLSIEEQFYLVFPLFLFILSRYFKRRLLTAIAVTLLASLFLSVAASFFARSANFYLLPMRAWELLAGCLLGAASIDKKTGERASSSLPLIGLLFIIISFAINWNDTPFRSLGQLLAIIGAVLILWKSSPHVGPVGKLLSLPPVVFIGVISYSLYLWHWPLIVILRYIGDFNSFTILTLAITIGILSYYIIEVSTRHLPNKKFAWVFSAAVLILTLSLSLPFIANRSQINYEPPEFWSNINLQPIFTAELEGHVGDYKTGLLIDNLDEDERLDVLVIGDSHSIMFFPAIRMACKENGLSAAFYGAGGGTSPFFIKENANPENYYGEDWAPEQRLDFDRYRREFIQTYRPRKIIVCGRWEYYRKIMGAGSLTEHLTSLVELGPNIDYTFVGQPPVLPFGSMGFTSGILEHPALRGFQEKDYNRDLRVEANELIKRFAENTPNCEYISTEELFLRANSIRYIENGKMLYKDDDHLSVEGSMQCLELFEQYIR